jgi:hypothetical protein
MDSSANGSFKIYLDVDSVKKVGHSGYGPNMYAKLKLVVTNKQPDMAAKIIHKGYLCGQNLNQTLREEIYLDYELKKLAEVINHRNPPLNSNFGTISETVAKRVCFIGNTQ